MTKKSDRSPKVLPSGVSPLRYMVSQAHGTEYLALTSLTAARECKDGVVIFEGDEGGTIYLTVPALQVVCSEATLKQLLLDIDEMCWRDRSSVHLVYEALPVGSGVAGGMGGGRVMDTLWLHPELENLGLRHEVEAVLQGGTLRLEPKGRRWS
jgi:hypothetical protein